MGTANGDFGPKLHYMSSALLSEKDMPIEDLLAMYGYSEGGAEGSQSNSSEEILSNQDLTLDKEIIGRDLLGEGRDSTDKEVINVNGTPEENLCDLNDTESSEAGVTQPTTNDFHAKDPESLLHELYKDDPISEALGARHLRSGSQQQSDEEEEEDEDGDYSPEEEEWKKTVMVGSEYQALIPENLHKYDDAMPYENEDKLLWDPSTLSDRQIKEFLGRIQSAKIDSEDGFNSIPVGSHIRDDEQALYVLLQCGHNTDEAIRRKNINNLPNSPSMSLWSEEECRNFESGLRLFGKDFHSIQQNKVRTRCVGELVQFYYLWKKTERHDAFAVKARLEKKKYNLHPGTTDYMERFLDEQETPSSNLPNVHSLLSGDSKRQMKTPPPLLQNNEPLEPPNNSSRGTSSHSSNVSSTGLQNHTEQLCNEGLLLSGGNGALPKSKISTNLSISVRASSPCFHNNHGHSNIQ